MATLISPPRGGGGVLAAFARGVTR